MNPDPDYSAAYAIVRTDTEDLVGHGLHVHDRLGPEKGVIHLATAALVNAVWDLYAKIERKPLWKLLVDMTPEELVACVPFAYIADALNRDDALDILRAAASTKSAREAELLEQGFPAYTTSAGWLGYPDEKIRRLAREARAAGWRHFKMKVGRDTDGDVRRAALLREEISADAKLMMDANQIWDVGEAIARMGQLREFDPWWIESRPAPTTCLATPRSPGRSRRFASPPASTSTTASCSSSSCRRT